MLRKAAIIAQSEGRDQAPKPPFRSWAPEPPFAWALRPASIRQSESGSGPAIRIRPGELHKAVI